jgi:hypothetical protein
MKDKGGIENLQGEMIQNDGVAKSVTQSVPARTVLGGTDAFKASE